MTNEQRYALKLMRYNRLAASPKNLKCPGVLRKLRRQLKLYTK